MRATIKLPEHYHQQATLDLSKSKKLLVGTIAFGIVLLVAVAWLLVQYTRLLRPDALEAIGFRNVLTVTPDGSITFGLPLGAALVAFVLVTLIHELMHGLFFWWFAGQPPKVGFKGLLVYVAAPPDVLFPRDQYLIVGAAPLVLLTLAGLVLMLIVPLAAVPILSFFIVFNAAGSAGDVVMALLLSSHSADSLMRDIDTGLVIYGREKDHRA